MTQGINTLSHRAVRSRAGKAVAALISAVAAGPVLAVSVVPGATGFGVDTPAGRGGVVHRVTNLNASGAGSLKACIEASGPRVCVFEVSGTIATTEELNITNPNITIAGQTAPSPGILIKGAGLRIAASHVLVQHLRVRVGDSAIGPDPGNRDALKIEAPASSPIHHVVVDHCSFSWSVDEVASIWEGASDVSLLSNIFSEPLDDSIHSDDGSPPAPHGYGVIFGPARNGVGRISLVGNLLAHQVARNPLAYSDFVMTGNLIYNFGQSAVEVANVGVTTSVAIAGNVFRRGPNSDAGMLPIYVRGGTGIDVVLTGTRLYLADNRRDGVNPPGDPWTLAWVQPTVEKGALMTSSPPLWPSGHVAVPPATESILGSVGARPADRDSVDSRVVSEVRNSAGQIINCVSADGTQRCQKNGGGWPSLPVRTRALALPANADRIGFDGYTVLEKWLHGYAAEVEGKTEIPTPPKDTQLL
jgi:hypothetical protein